MSGDLVRYDVADHIATITLNDPERRNPLSDAMIKALVAALERFRTDSDARVLILTGAGRSFCSGGDLKRMSRVNEGEEGAGAGSKFDPIVQREWYREGIQRIPKTLSKIEKPTIAAINGHAIGAGNDLALMCDLRIASSEAKFGESFCRVGLAPGDGGAWLLVRAVGLQKACEMIFTGDIIDAAEAQRIGMILRAVPPDRLMDEARELAGRIARGPVLAHKAAKQAIYKGLHQTLEESLDFISLAQSMLHGTADHKEGVAAFLEKREPKFEGR